MRQAELQLPVNQALALFGKLVRKLSKRLQDVQKVAVEASLPEAPRALPAAGADAEDGAWKPVAARLADELDAAGDEATRALREKQREMIDALDLSK